MIDEAAKDDELLPTAQGSWTAERSNNQVMDYEDVYGGAASDVAEPQPDSAARNERTTYEDMENSGNDYGERTP